MKSRSLSFLFVLALFVASCGTVKDVTYFQDTSTGTKLTATSLEKIRFKTDDKVVIIVKSRDNQLTNLFNMPYITQRLGTSSDIAQNYSQGVVGYSVDADGCIDFPVLGKVKIEGMTRSEVENHIKSLLVSSNLVNDPVVTCDYMNLRVSVLGEVNKPGRYPIDHDSYTILDAISAAGDLAICGLRYNVKVMRMEDDVQKTYNVNLKSSRQLLSSPVYYLQQNDIVYVSPNAMRARQSTINGNSVLSASFWVSVISLAATIVTTVTVATSR